MRSAHARPPHCPGRPRSPRPVQSLADKERPHLAHVTRVAIWRRSPSVPRPDPAPAELAVALARLCEREGLDPCETTAVLTRSTHLVAGPAERSYAVAADVLDGDPAGTCIQRAGATGDGCSLKASRPCS